jgi:hypothetical protein
VITSESYIVNCDCFVSCRGFVEKNEEAICPDQLWILLPVCLKKSRAFQPSAQCIRAGTPSANLCIPTSIPPLPSTNWHERNAVASCWVNWLRRHLIHECWYISKMTRRYSDYRRMVISTGILFQLCSFVLNFTLLIITVLFSNARQCKIRTFHFAHSRLDVFCVILGITCDHNAYINNVYSLKNDIIWR